MDRDHSFLNRAIAILESLREKSVERGHPMLASLVEMARIEAEDDLRTAEAVDAIWSPFFARAAVERANASKRAEPPPATAAVPSS